MKTITKTYKVYKLEELSEKAKKKALDNYNEEDQSGWELSQILKNDLDYFLSEYKIEELRGLQLFYDLGYSQGDGTCFVGKFRWKDYDILITHHGHYYHYNSVWFEFEKLSDIPDGFTEADQDAVMDEDEAEFKEIYKEISLKLKKAGYAEIEWQHSEENFEELCNLNEWDFLESGKRFIA